MKQCLLSFFFIFIITATLQSQTITKDSLLKYSSVNNLGTEFWFSFPPCYEEVAGAENTTRVFVVSSIQQPVTVEVPGKVFAVTKMAPANVVIEFKLPSAIGQAYSKPTASKAPPEQVYAGCGVHVTANFPVVVYGMTRFQYTSDGFLALPVSRLGNDYVIASWPQYKADNLGQQTSLPAVSNIVAAYDNTEVTFTMGGLTGSQTTAGLSVGDTRKWMLNAGDVLCFANNAEGQDLGGSRVTSSKPIAVVSGNQCANIPKGIAWCDFTVEMELPTTAWGKEYHVPAHVDRQYNPYVRIFAHPDYKNVRIYRDGKEWAILPNNTPEINQRFIERRLNEDAPKSTYISADAPIYIMLYNTGQADDNVGSDPFQYVITPVEQYQKEIVFCTPNAKGGTLPFTKNYINLVYALGDGDVVPQDLEFAIMKNGQYEWRSVASRFGAGPGQIFSSATSAGLKYGMKRLTLPGDGVYSIRAKQPFAVYSYGSSDYDSYGFVSSTQLLDIASISKDTTPPTISIDKVPEFNQEKIISQKFSGTTVDPIISGISSKVSSIFLVPEYTKNMSLHIGKFDINNTIPVAWTVTIIDSTENARGILVSQDRSGNYSFKELIFDGAIQRGIILFNAPELAQVNVTNKEIATIKFSLKNTNQTDIIINEIHMSDSTNFRMNQTGYIGQTMASRSVLEIPVVFSTTQSGNYNCVITIKTNDDKAIQVLLQGKAVHNMVKVDSLLRFDSTQLNTGETKRLDGLIYPVKDGFMDTTYISGAQSDLNGTISFTPNRVGSEGFQVSLANLIGRSLISTSSPLTYSVRFKPIREGQHIARMNFLLNDTEKSSTITLVGYGKKTATSVDEFEAVSVVSVYPNPAKKQCTVQGLEGESTITIVNILGEEKMRISTNDNSVIIAIDSLENGNYSMIIHNSKRMYTLPLTVQE